MAAKQKILIVDDDNNIAELISLYLTKECFDTKIVNDGEEALTAFEQYNPNLILLDLMLPGIDGYQVCREVRAKANVPIIMLSAKGEVFDKVLGLELGADDYLVKPFAFAELLARVRTLLRRGNTMITESQLKVADLSVDLVSRKVSRAGNRIVLTSKEFSLLEFFIRHQGEVLPRSLIASQVWDMNFDSDTNAIDVAVKRLRAKIDNDYGTKLIQTVRGVGYMLEIPDA